ncbi:MAG: NEW3 domain-containing protein [Candidatus Micrarchaeia archaeon]
MEKLAYIIAALIALAMALPFAGAQIAGSSADGALSLVNVGISPQPVIAGSNATVTFQLYNSYSTELQNVNLQLESQSPLINVSPTYTFLIDAIGTGLYGGIGYNEFSYKFHVPSTLPSGEYTIDVVADYEAQQSQGLTTQYVPAQSEMPISFYVYGLPRIGLSAAPVQIQPGNEFVVSADASNGGSGLVQNMSVSIKGSNAFKVVGPSTFYLGNMPAGASIPFSFMLEPSQYLDNGTYSVNATITYTSQFGKEVQSNSTILLNVAIDKPMIALSLLGSMPQNLYAGSNQTLEFDVTNAGSGLARNVSISFFNTSAISLGSVSSFFISALAPGMSVQENLFISANRNDNSTMYNIPVRISYESANYRNATTKLQYIPISMHGTADFNITEEYGQLAPGASYVPLTFHIINTGNEAAQQVSFSLQTVYPITPVTPNAYVSSIAPGQSANVTFYVSIDTQANSGSYPVTIYEQWQQPNGSNSQLFSSSNNYFAMVGSNKKGNASMLYVETAVAAIIVVAIIARMRRSMKAKHKGK